MQDNWTESASQRGGNWRQAQCLKAGTRVHLPLVKRCGKGIVNCFLGWSPYVAIELWKLEDTLLH